MAAMGDLETIETPQREPVGQHQSCSARTATGWAQDCGMAYSVVGDVITVNRACLTRLVRQLDSLPSRYREHMQAAVTLGEIHEEDANYAADVLDNISTPNAESDPPN